jgi:hypothetical protein
MTFRLTLKNYRCFADEDPARFDIGDGFVSFVGLNNSGKSSLLKFFYEFREIFRHLSSGSGYEYWKGGGAAFNLAGVTDPLEVFTTFNDRPLQFSIEFDAPVGAFEGPFRLRLEVTVERQPPNTSPWTFRSQMFVNEVRFDAAWRGGSFNPKPLMDELSSLARTLYIGPFRNVLSLAPEGPYFDITVGRAFVERWRAQKTRGVKAENRAARQLEREICQIFGFESLYPFTMSVTWW